MGQKVHPKANRIGITTTWKSKWYAEKNFADYLHEDRMIRNLVKKQLSHAGISNIEIERYTKKLRITIHTARPGIIIGRRGQEVERLKKLVQSKTDKQVLLNIQEIKQADLDSQLVAENIALQLENRASFRRTLKRSIQSVMQAGALGTRVVVSGRLGGAEMSRVEGYREGRVPLHTYRADIDYGFAEARTTYGVIGVKVWIFKGEILPRRGQEPITEEEAPAHANA
ncbi:MAG: 30S ribosomal protein S3 [Candidatus Omnitrophica bacterium]|nr:30S ribosomal protein S3 [bacterium]NUN97462.1 30S ribosomal protein S3 [Candidatus Omnitrophota bacterium]